MRYLCMAPGAELQNRSRKVFTTKSTKNTKFGFCHRFEKGVIARRPQADVSIQVLEIATVTAQPRNAGIG